MYGDKRRDDGYEIQRRRAGSRESLELTHLVRLFTCTPINATIYRNAVILGDRRLPSISSKPPVLLSIFVFPSPSTRYEAQTSPRQLRPYRYRTRGDN